MAAGRGPRSSGQRHQRRGLRTKLLERLRRDEGARVKSTTTRGLRSVNRAKRHEPGRHRTFIRSRRQPWRWRHRHRARTGYAGAHMSKLDAEKRRDRRTAAVEVIAVRSARAATVSRCRRDSSRPPRPPDRPRAADPARTRNCRARQVTHRRDPIFGDIASCQEEGGQRSSSKPTPPALRCSKRPSPRFRTTRCGRR